jgi:glycerophosphoryl diester phosphodiesterase
VTTDLDRKVLTDLVVHRRMAHAVPPLVGAFLIFVGVVRCGALRRIDSRRPWGFGALSSTTLRVVHHVANLRRRGHREQRRPVLEEVISTVPAGKKLVIEIKSGVDTVAVLADGIKGSPKRGQFVVIAFSFDVASEAKKRLTDLPVYWLWGFSEREKKEYGDPSLDDLIAKAKGASLDGLDLNNKGPLTKEFVADVKRAGMEVIVYTVDDPVAAKDLVGMGVAGITTNRPAFLRERIAGSR